MGCIVEDLPKAAPAVGALSNLSQDSSALDEALRHGTGRATSKKILIKKMFQEFNLKFDHSKKTT